MLNASVVIFCVVVLLGLVLAAMHASVMRKPPWWLGGVHGVLGVLGLGAVLLSLRGPPRGIAMGAGNFGAISAVLLGCAVLTGLVPVLARLRCRRMPVLVLGLHATIALMGFLVLATYVSMPS